MMAKPIRALELRYPMIQSLKTSVMCPYRLCLHVFRIFLKTHLFVSATLIRFLNTLWFRNRVDTKSRYFFTRWRNKIEPSSLLWILYSRWQPRCMLCFQYSRCWLLEWIWIRVDACGRANSIWIWIRVDMKFFNPERKSCGLEKYLGTFGRGLICYKTWEITGEWQNRRLGSNKYVSHA